MTLLFGGIIDQVLDGAIEVDRVEKRLLNYHRRKYTLFFKNLVVSKLKERKVLVKNMHEEIGHFSKRRTLAEVKKRFFWHDKVESMKVVVK